MLYFLTTLPLHLLPPQHGTQMELSAGLDHHLYTPFPIRGRTIPSPNPFCFVMKV